MHLQGTKRVGVIGYLALDFLGTPGAIIVDYSGANLAFLSG
jgi:hypothetical protein